VLVVGVNMQQEDEEQNCSDARGNHRLSEDWRAVTNIRMPPAWCPACRCNA